MINVTRSIFSQILGLFSRGEFEALVRQHGAERHARGFSCWTQLALKIQFEPGTIVVFDRGYYRFGWWLRLTRQKVLFVSRLKDNAQ